MSFEFITAPYGDAANPCKVLRNLAFRVPHDPSKLNVKSINTMYSYLPTNDYATGLAYCIFHTLGENMFKK